MRKQRSRVHVREFLADTLTPVAVYERLAGLSPTRFLFESVTGGEQVSRYSFLGAAPRALVRLHPDRVEVEDLAGTRVLESPPLVALAEVLGSIEPTTPSAESGELPFRGGYVGFFGFDLVRLAERLPARPPDPFDLPLAVLGRFDHLVVFDHARQRVLAVANEIDGEVSDDEARRDLDRLSELLEESQVAGATRVHDSIRDPETSALEPRVSLEDKAYREAVDRAKAEIVAGEIFQVVLARHFRLDRGELRAQELYQALRAVNPSPYMVLLELPEVALVGASPEMLVRKSGSLLETRPIAGTRRRGETAEQDRRLERELRADEKERAEHVMLVDLGRNDLGRVAVPGSVRVSTFQEVERYSHVMHLVSSVEAEAEAGTSALEALLACFPAGTVSGAPKIRAIEIIDELEPEARGPYAGAAGYISFDGDLDTCITIRTFVVQGDEISVTAGAGIVADSQPVREEEETREKAAALLAAIELARRLSR